MKKVALFGLLALALTACTPSAMHDAGSALNGNLSIYCTGKSFGTVTSAQSVLNITVDSYKAARGTFTNNGTTFSAYGTYSGSALNLTLSTGRTNGSLNGYITSNQFSGSFKGLLGTYQTVMGCRGA